MNSMHSWPWLSTMVAVGLSVFGMTVRAVVLLVGLLVTLPKVPRNDRVKVFRDFSRAPYDGEFHVRSWPRWPRRGKGTPTLYKSVVPLR